MIDLNKVSYCKIHPPVGIARVGDSEESDGYFIAPEWPDGPIDTPHGAVERDLFRYRDHLGRIKRQAARFRVYAYDAQDQVMGELTDAQATITWTATLANKKAGWFGFFGSERARTAFRGEHPEDAFGNKVPLRNPDTDMMGHLVREQGGPHGHRFVADEKRSAQLEIKGERRSVSGPNRVHAARAQRPADRFLLDFTGKFRNRTEVYLGELATDAAGRLIVLGGRGASRPVDAEGNPHRNPAQKWITNYANNNDWHDDTSDGPITAEVVLKADGNDPERSIDTRGGAWVVVAPPDFAPDITNLVTMYDVMEEVAIDAPSLVNLTTPQPRQPDNPDLRNDIWPIIERSAGYRWVSPLGLRGHGQGKAGDALNAQPTVFDSFKEGLNGAGNKLRDRLFDMVRPPTYERPSGEKPSSKAMMEALRYANATFMPPLSGDEGDRETGSPANWLTLTYVQYQRLKTWRHAPLLLGPESPLPATCLKDGSLNPDTLIRAVLERACGGAFFPGIEITSIARDPKLYVEAFRFDHAVLEAGDVTKYMALPWQADFYECRTWWWPAQRPDDVILEESFKEIFSEFEAEKTGDLAGTFERLLMNRTPWDRGVGAAAPRPGGQFLLNLVLPIPNDKETATDYVQRLTGTDPEVPRGWARILLGAASAEDGSPWRRQFLVQEAYDTYSGRYCHLIAPDPTTVLDFKTIAETHPDLVSRYALTSLADLRLAWREAGRVQAPEIVGALAAIREEYELEVVRCLQRDLGVILQKHPDYPKDPAVPGSAKPFHSVIADVLDETVDKIDQVNPDEVYRDSQLHRRYAPIELRDALRDRVYVAHSIRNGDNGMVQDWRQLGFVVPRTYPLGNGKSLTVQVEAERNKYDGASARDQFYHLMNIQDYPDFHPEAQRIAERGLAFAKSLIESTSVDDPDHPEAHVPFDATTYKAKLDEIYEIQRARGQNYDLFYDLRRRTREGQLRGLLDLAPYNQCDGSWLRNIAVAGPADDVRSLLFEIWSDEIGNGDPALHHGNLYTVLLNSVGFTLHDIKTRAYADDPRIPELMYVNPVFQLAISLHTDQFYPELLGMTLFLEWEVLSVVEGIMRQEYLGIDPQFLRMHVGIDNATSGHGAKARDAVLIYLDKIRSEGGDAAVQEHWTRIWRGFVAFSVVGTNLFGNDIAISRRRPPNPAQRLAEMMSRKQRYGSQNHLANKLGEHRINDLFDDPGLFQLVLSQSRWIVPGNPNASTFINHLTTFAGPMYKIFDANDIATWRAWIEWLGREGDTPTVKRYYEKGEAVEKLLHELRSQAEGVPAHKRYKLALPASTRGGRSKRLPVAEFFASGDMIGFMRALKDPENGWVVSGAPADSPLLADMARGGRPMGDALDRRYPTIGNRIGRQVLIEWVRAGCPIPGEPPPAPAATAEPLKSLGPKLFMHTHGFGAVH